MKKHLYMVLTATILCSTTHSALSMQNAKTIAKLDIAGLCSLIELFVTSAPLIDSIVFNPTDKRIEKLKNIQSDTSECITNFFEEIAQSRHISNIKIRLNGDHHDYATDGNSVLIPIKQANELEYLLNNKNRTTQENKKLNEHIGTIHHELTHCTMESLKYVPMYETAMGTTGAVISTMTLTHFINKHIPIVHKNFALHNCFKIVRSALTLACTFKLSQLDIYKKYDELKADDGVPNIKELLEAQAKKFRTNHTQYLQCIDIIKEKADYQTILFKDLPDDIFNRKKLFIMKTLPTAFFNSPLIMDAVFHLNEEHPSDIRRTHRFEQKIKNLNHIETSKYKEA